MFFFLQKNESNFIFCITAPIVAWWIQRRYGDRPSMKHISVIFCTHQTPLFISSPLDQTKRNLHRGSIVQEAKVHYYIETPVFNVDRRRPLWSCNKRSVNTERLLRVEAIKVDALDDRNNELTRSRQRRDDRRWAQNAQMHLLSSLL